MKYFKITILCVLAFAATHCSVKYILNTSVKKNDAAWELKIHSMKSGPDSFIKIIDPDNSAKVTTLDPTNGFFWVKMEVKNVSGKARTFNFERVRVIADDYIAKPEYAYSESLFDRENFLFTIQPHDSVTRWLIFLHKKGSNPYRLVYDTFQNNVMNYSLGMDLGAY